MKRSPTSFIAARKFRTPRESAWFTKTLLGLQHIHQQGMVHRDLSPSNLMLTPPRPPGTPDDTLHATLKILDIGVGRILFDENVTGAGDGPQLTTAGMMLGTATYMAPEQGRNAHRADIRSDIYSLGCVLYQVLTGQPPFAGERDFEIILQHLTQSPRPVRELEPSVPAGLQAVLATLLAKDPGQRYATPEKASQALRPFLGAPDRPNEQASSLTRSYLHWVEAQPLEEVDDKPLAVGRWYYSRDGLAIGPFPTAQLAQLAVAGKLGPADLLWMEGDNPDLAIPARAAVDFSGLKSLPRALLPPRPTGPTVAEMGHDPETGQILDPVKFKNWQRQQKEKRDREQAAVPTVGEVFEKARIHIDRWLDFDRNRRPIMAGDMEIIRRDPDIHRFMQFHARYGPDMLHKLWNHLQFMVENRRKYYGAGVTAPMPFFLRSRNASKCKRITCLRLKGNAVPLPRCSTFSQRPLPS